MLKFNLEDGQLLVIDCGHLLESNDCSYYVSSIVLRHQVKDSYCGGIKDKVSAFPSPFPLYYTPLICEHVT